MIREINTGSEESVLNETETNGLGRLCFSHPAGTFSVTPASRILFRAIIEHMDLLQGIGIDWGSGIGCQAILCARIPAVQMVYGLEIAKPNIVTSAQNAELNEVAKKVRFLLSDSYQPFEEQGKREIESLKGKVDFVLSNPPSSEGDDGFSFRRMVLDGARAFLKPGGVVLVNASFQYGRERVLALAKEHLGYRYVGVAATTASVPFDLGRADLVSCLQNYAAEEQRGGTKYTFIANESENAPLIDARKALQNYEEHGVSPFTKWQTHQFRYER